MIDHASIPFVPRDEAAAAFGAALEVARRVSAGGLSREQAIAELVAMGHPSELSASSFLLHATEQPRLDKIRQKYGIISG